MDSFFSFSFFTKHTDNRSGGLDKSAIAFMTRPRIIFSGLCMLLVTLVFIFCLSDIIVNGSFIRTPVPLPPPPHPILELPTKCYGQVRKTNSLIFIL